MNKKRKSIVLALAFLLAAILFLPHAKETLAATPRLNKTSVTLAKGSRLQLKVSGTSQKIKWSTSNKKIATVSAKGVVRGKTQGAAKITAKVGKKKLTCKVTVDRPKLDRTQATVGIGGSVSLKLTGTKGKAEWLTSDNNVAIASQSGVVTGLREGSCRIYVHISETSLICTVTVSANIGTIQPNPTINPTIPPRPTVTPTPTPVITQPPVNDSKQKISLLESGWRTFSSWDYTYVSWAVRIKNPNMRYAVEYPTITITARDSSGRILKNEERVLSAIAANDTIIYGDTLAYEGAEPSRVDISVSCEDEWFSTQDSKRFVTQKSFAFSNITRIDKTDENISVYTGEITNNSGVNFGTVAAMVVYSKGGKVVGGEVTYIDNLHAGATKPFEFRAYSGITQYDSYDFYAVQW